jgi:hypothetical protein
MLSHSIGRVNGTRTLGSGWALYTRDYPHYKAYKDYALIYDSTMTGPA